MDIALFIVVLASLYGLQISRGFNTEYMAINNTRVVNGVFVMLVFMRHFGSYVASGNGDYIFRVFDSHIGQLIVVPFLFYSGYGIMISIMKKGDNYIDSFLSRRLFRVWYHFALAVAMFAIYRLLVKDVYDLKTTLLAFTGWTSLGNSNWYMLDIFVMYLITYCAFRIIKKSKQMHYW